MPSIRQSRSVDTKLLSQIFFPHLKVISIFLCISQKRTYINLEQIFHTIVVPVVVHLIPRI